MHDWFHCHPQVRARFHRVIWLVNDLRRFLSADGDAIMHVNDDWIKPAVDIYIYMWKTHWMRTVDVGRVPFARLFEYASSTDNTQWPCKKCLKLNKHTTLFLLFMPGICCGLSKRNRIVIGGEMLKHAVDETMFERH